ncbi:hypothetical protein [Candidatus Similichlamydia epinepheli]|uniref:hypothetical protein n=1 Tax=Candidatus Similichlamydia epinepheli TaxID=1903953 RepID=UPI000D34F26D|nr:hypothetical protein [Candidatus Similichlamydia epinepheli]
MSVEGPNCPGLGDPHSVRVDCQLPRSEFADGRTFSKSDSSSCAGLIKMLFKSSQKRFANLSSRICLVKKRCFTSIQKILNGADLRLPIKILIKMTKASVLGLVAWCVFAGIGGGFQSSFLLIFACAILVVLLVLGLSIHFSSKIENVIFKGEKILDGAMVFYKPINSVILACCNLMSYTSDLKHSLSGAVVAIGVKLNSWWKGLIINNVSNKTGQDSNEVGSDLANEDVINPDESPFLLISYEPESDPTLVLDIPSSMVSVAHSALSYLCNVGRYFLGSWSGKKDSQDDSVGDGAEGIIDEETGDIFFDALEDLSEDNNRDLSELALEEGNRVIFEFELPNNE